MTVAATLSTNFLSVLRDSPGHGLGLQRYTVADQGPAVSRRPLRIGQQRAPVPARLERDHQRCPAAVEYSARLLDGGAYLMAIKRYAEYRFINSAELAGLYRRSFRYYTEESLLASAFFYALCSAFFLGVFLIKYRIEFLLSIPFLALLFTWYLVIGMRSQSPAQSPEKLYREKPFVLYVAALGCLIVVLFFVHLPWLNVLVQNHALQGR
jgi:hypothetical protein